MQTSPHVPFDGSYWVEPARLLAGRSPGDTLPRVVQGNLTALLDCGIRHFINLMDEPGYDHRGVPFPSYSDSLKPLAVDSGVEVTYVHMPIVNMDVPSRQMMRVILDDIDRALAAENPVYVHCWGGIGRTGTVVGCYLSRHGLAQGDEAISMIQELRRHISNWQVPSPENEIQRAMIRSWEAGE